MPAPLIIDDLDCARAQLSDLGRAITAEPAKALRSAVAEYAARRGWTWVPYSSYLQWVLQRIESTDDRCLVLDPIFPLEEAGDATFLRITRSARKGYYDVDDDALPDSPEQDRPYCLVDDAVGSGGTLSCLSHIIARRGGRVSEFVICAATQRARQFLGNAFPHVRWSLYHAGDWRVCHLRDGFPHLPFTGRQTGRSIILPDGAPLELRAPVTEAANNLWQVLDMDRGIHHAIEAAHRSVAHGLADHLERVATVGDLTSLGERVSLVTRHWDSEIRPDTALQSLIGSS